LEEPGDIKGDLALNSPLIEIKNAVVSVPFFPEFLE
jgi:hypothetical protein